MLGSFSLALYSIVSSNCLKEVDNMTQSFWASVSGSVCSVILSAILEHLVVPEITSDWLLIFGHAVSVSVLNMLTIVSVSLVSPLVVGLLRPLHLVLMFILQETLLKDAIGTEASIMEIIGKFILCDIINL